MKSRDKKLREWKPFDRFAFVFLGLMLIATGTLSLLRGHLHYPNVWGEAVFAPFVIFGGLLTLVVAFMLRMKGK